MSTHSWRVEYIICRRVLNVCLVHISHRHYEVRLCYLPGDCLINESYCFEGCLFFLFCILFFSWYSLNCLVCHELKTSKYAMPCKDNQLVPDASDLVCQKSHNCRLDKPHVSCSSYWIIGRPYFVFFFFKAYSIGLLQSPINFWSYFFFSYFHCIFLGITAICLCETSWYSVAYVLEAMASERTTREEPHFKRWQLLF